MTLLRFGVWFSCFTMPLFGQTTLSAKSAFVTTSDGARLHYVEAGTGTPILFVPGLTMAAEIWDAQIRYFAKDHRVVAMDPRSQGESEKVTEGHFPERRARDIKEVIDALRLSPVVLVGWSMGGPEALSYVAHFGSNALRALVLVDSFIGDEPAAARPAGHFRTTMMIQANRVEWTRNWVRGMFAKPKSADYLQKLTDASLKTPTNTMVLLILNTYVADGDDRRPILSKLNRPVLYVGRAAMRSQAENVKKVVPAARIELLENVGHALFVDEPDQFNNLLDDFITHL